MENDIPTLLNPANGDAFIARLKALSASPLIVNLSAEISPPKGARELNINLRFFGKRALVQWTINDDGNIVFVVFVQKKCVLGLSLIHI